MSTDATSDKYIGAEHFNTQSHSLLAITVTSCPSESLPNPREGLRHAHIQQLIVKAKTINPDELHGMTDH